MAKITITLGTADNGETPIKKANLVIFKNETGGPTTLTTSKGIHHPKDTTLADGETSKPFSINANAGSVLVYEWTVSGLKLLATRGGTIRVTP